MIPNKIYRLTRKKYATIEEVFSGKGGIYAPGRWHTQGSKIVYFSSSMSLALLETIVNLNVSVEEFHAEYVFIELEIVPGVIQSNVVRSFEHNEIASIDAHWRLPHNLTCRRIGQRWYRQGKHAVLSIPSAVVPYEKNYLINCQRKFVSQIRDAISIKLNPNEPDDRIARILDFNEHARRRNLSLDD